MSVEESLRLVRFDQTALWNDFVDRHPFGSIFHRREMIRAFATTKRHEPYAYAAIDGQDQIWPLLSTVKISTLARYADSFAARSIFYAEPVYSDSENGRRGVQALLKQHDEYMRKRTLFSEVRPLFPPPTANDPLKAESYDHLGYMNYELNLRESHEALFKRMNSKCKNNIRSSERQGLIVEEVEPNRELDDFYDLVAESYAGSKVPMADRSLLESVFRELQGPVCRLFLVRYQGQLAAGACFLAYKGRVIYWYAGARRIPGVAAMASLVWHAIKLYSSEGYETFDFAGAGWEGEDYGPGRFKAKFGGELTNYGRYRRIYSPWKMWSATSAYEALRGWISPRSTKSESSNL